MVNIARFGVLRWAEGRKGIEGKDVFVGRPMEG